MNDNSELGVQELCVSVFENLWIGSNSVTVSSNIYVCRSARLRRLVLCSRGSKLLSPTFFKHPEHFWFVVVSSPPASAHFHPAVTSTSPAPALSTLGTIGSFFAYFILIFCYHYKTRRTHRFASGRLLHFFCIPLLLALGCSHVSQPRGHCTHAFYRFHIASYRRHPLLDGNGTLSESVRFLFPSHIRSEWQRDFWPGSDLHRCRIHVHQGQLSCCSHRNPHMHRNRCCTRILST